MPKSYEDLLLKEVKDLLKKLPPNVRIRVYYGSKEEQDVIMRPRKKSRYTLNQIGDMVVGIKDDLKQVNTRIDNLEKNINARLDYIVKANDLKDLPRK